jgi:cardiolipin synthase
MSVLSPPSPWLRKKRWKLPTYAWLLIIAAVLVIGVVLSFFLERRAILDFCPDHTFTVRDPAFFASAHALGDPVPLPGNKIDLLQNGDETFPALLGAIRGAKKSVNFEAFLFYSGTIGRQFRDAFIERAQAGVHVRVLLDGVGSGLKLDNSDVELMQRGGVHFSYYHPMASWRLDRFNRRTHRRVMVVDGKVAFTGSIGFADQWQGHGESDGHWRDVHARIEGPLVGKLQGAFQQHWVRATREAMGGPDEFPELPAAGKLVAQMTSTHSFSIAPLPLTQAVAIAAAERRISIINPYCTPSDDQVALLGAAVKRGVNVRLLLPGKHNDQPMTKAAGRTAYGKLLESGVKIYEYAPAMIHTKIMVVDGLFSIFGSSNLDARSAAINEELDISVYDEGFGRQMEELFENDLKNSKPYTLDQFKQRGPWERFSEMLMMPIHSQL